LAGIAGGSFLFWRTHQIDNSKCEFILIDKESGLKTDNSRPGPHFFSHFLGEEFYDQRIHVEVDR
jgi:hypothetical protein